MSKKPKELVIHYLIKFTDEDYGKSKAKNIKGIVKVLEEYGIDTDEDLITDFLEKNDLQEHTREKMNEKTIRKLKNLRKQIKIEEIPEPKEEETPKRQNIGKIRTEAIQKEQDDKEEQGDKEEQKPKKLSERLAEMNQKKKSAGQSSAGEMPQRREPERTTNFNGKGKEKMIYVDGKPITEATESKPKKFVIKDLGKSEKIDGEELDKIIPVLKDIFKKNTYEAFEDHLTEKEFNLISKTKWEYLLKFIRLKGHESASDLLVDMNKKGIIKTIKNCGKKRIYVYNKDLFLFQRLGESAELAPYLRKYLETVLKVFIKLVKILRKSETSKKEPQLWKLDIYNYILGEYEKIEKKLDGGKTADNALTNFITQTQLEISPEQQADTDHLLPIKGGKVLDFNTGEVRKRTSEDFFLSEVPTAYKPELLNSEAFYRSRFWKFINQFCAEDPNLLKKWQRFLGYCITGYNNMRKIAFVLNDKKTGKSELINVLESILGSLCGIVLPSVICESSKKNVLRPDLIDAFSYRLAFIVEMSEKDRIDMENLKQMTGDKSMKVRDYFKFVKCVLKTKFIISSNQSFNIAQNNDSDKDRIYRLESQAKFYSTEKEKEDYLKLLESGSAKFTKIYPAEIDFFKNFTEEDRECGLAWIIKGAIDYCREKSLFYIEAETKPDNETELINDLENDEFKNFINETVEFVDDDSVKLKRDDLINRFNWKSKGIKQNEARNGIDRVMESLLHGKKQGRDHLYYPKTQFKPIINNDSDDD